MFSALPVYQRLPGIVFFDAQGREIKGLRVIGYQSAERFLKTLSLATAP